MALHGPKDAFLLVGGRNLSSDTWVLDETMENLQEETHGLGATWVENTAVGIARVTLEASGGLYDDRTAGNVEAFQGMGSTLQPVDYGFSGSAAGAHAITLNGSYAATWKRMLTKDGLTKAHAIHRMSAIYYRARVLHGITAETTDPGTGTAVDHATDIWNLGQAVTSSSVANPTVITVPKRHNLTSGAVVLFTGHTGSTPNLNGGNGYIATVTGDYTFTVPVNVTVGGTGGTFQEVSSYGASANLHTLALSLGTYTSVVIKVRHSPDNSTYTDLLTFSNVTAANTSNSQSAPVTTLVNRWTMMTWDFQGSGSGSITPYVALGRP